MLETALIAASVTLLCVAAATHWATERTLRAAGGLVERLQLPETAAGLAASAAGLPDRIDTTQRHVALFVSVSCPVCHRIVGSLQGTVPEGLTVVVTDTDLARAQRWVRKTRMQGNVIADDGTVAAALGIASAPTAVGFSDGAAQFALKLGGPAALDGLMRPSR